MSRKQSLPRRILGWLMGLSLLLVVPWAGPVTAATWENLNPGAGGQIQDLVPDPHHPGRLIYCSDVEGSYLSEDNGATWNYCTRETFSTNTLTATFDPEDRQRVYLGMHTGMALSGDGGRTLHTRPDLYLFGLFGGYEHKFEKATLRIQGNIENLFDKEYEYGFVTARWLQAPRTYRLSTSIKF